MLVRGAEVGTVSKERDGWHAFGPDGTECSRVRGTREAAGREVYALHAKFTKKQEMRDLARDFRRVEYRYHQELFELLGYADIAKKFDRLWQFCRPRIGDPHKARVRGQEPSYWLSCLERPEVRSEFLRALSDVLEDEAKADAKRDRPLLAKKLRNTVTAILKHA